MRYHEYSDDERSYVLSLDISDNDTVYNAMLFVYDDENSFMCGCTDLDMTPELATELRSVTLEQRE